MANLFLTLSLIYWMVGKGRMKALKMALFNHTRSQFALEKKK